MNKLRFSVIIICLSLLVTSLGLPALAAPAAAAPGLSSAQSALVGDMDSGRILYGVDADSRREPASLTKMMTLLIAVEAVEAGDVSLDDMVTASANCKSGMSDDSSTSDIHYGETMSLRDLMYCTALASANEACNIIAEYLSGTIDAFVQRMNGRAAELGCSGTHFVNTHGMPDPDHYTTARDMFIIAREGMSHELFATLVGTSEYTTAPTNTSDGRDLVNSNALLSSKSPYGDYAYDGARGIKTGHTSAAGYCLVAAAERGDVSLITVVLGASGNVETGDFDNFRDTVKLLDWAFESYTRCVIAEKGSAVATQPIDIDGRKGELTLVCAQDITALLPTGVDVAGLAKNITLNSELLTELPAEGTELGIISFPDPADGTEYGSATLLASTDAQFDEEQPTADDGTQGLRSQQKIAIVIVCAIVVLLLLLFLLRLTRFLKAH